ncbi:MAG: hypothetical protein WKF34_10770 [Pyrinomonadaceae bacterium]
MLRRTLTIIFSGILLSTAFGFQSVHAQTDRDAQLAAKARAEVQKLGVGRDARVEVRMRDNTKLKGSINVVGEHSFSITDSKTGASQTVAYADVTQVKRSGSGLSARTWVVIGAAAVAAAIVAVVVLKPALCDGGAQTGGLC